MPKIFYELRFDIFPRGKPEVHREYRKDSRLIFPPPIGTEVFISPPKTHAGGGAFFEVSGYEHGVGEYSNQTRREETFIVVLRSMDKLGDEEFCSLLESDGWKNVG